MADTASRPHLHRRLGLRQSIALNMGQMCGVGPFITIPAMVVAFGGPQAIMGWVFGALLALCDGLVWAELGAAMPGSGGTYVYLREAFQYRTGRLMPFLFVWTTILFIPLIMSTGVYGFVAYLQYLWPGMTTAESYVVGLAMVVLIIALLWRRIDSIGRLAQVLWVLMIATVVTVIIAAFTDFHASQAFDFPSGAFDISNSGFWVGFAAGLTVGIYDYLGYNTTAYLGAEVRKPGRTIPWSIVVAIFAMATIYLAMQIGVLGVVDWHEMLNESSPAYTSVVSLVLERSWGATAAKIVTVFILVTAFTSVFAGLLAGSRVPYDAARDGVFFKAYARLHPQARVPDLRPAHDGRRHRRWLRDRPADLDHHADPLLTTVMVLVQSFAQIAALFVLRKRQPTLRRPYKMTLYPIPAILALIGWVVIYVYADKNAPGLHPIEWSLGWLVLGLVAFAIWARARGQWPFGPLEVRERYVEADPALLDYDDEELPESEVRTGNDPAS